MNLRITLERPQVLPSCPEGLSEQREADVFYFNAHIREVDPHTYLRAFAQNMSDRGGVQLLNFRGMILGVWFPPAPDIGPWLFQGTAWAGYALAQKNSERNAMVVDERQLRDALSSAVAVE